MSFQNFSKEFQTDIQNSVVKFTENNIYMCVEYKDTFQLETNKDINFCCECHCGKLIPFKSENLLYNFSKTIHIKKHYTF